MNILLKYRDMAFKHLLLFSPLCCLCAGLHFTTSKLFGLYSSLSWNWVILFDITHFIYLFISLFFIWRKRKNYNSDELLPYAKIFITISLLIQYNFIMQLFASQDVWICTSIFLVLIVFYFDFKMMITNTIFYAVSLTIAHIMHPEQYLGIGTTNLFNMLFYRVLCLGLTSFILIEIAYFVEKFFEKTQQEEMEKQFLIEQQFEYYQNLNIMDKEIRRFRHDIRNHFLCIQGLAEKKQYTELENYFKDLTDTFASKNTLYFSGNVIIDSILNYHLSHLEKPNIKPIVFGKLPELNQVTSMDLCTIFSNMISNAVKSINKCNTSLPVLQIAFEYGDNYFSIAITNTPDSSLLCDNKHRSRNHGHGLRIIKHTIEKYNGVFEQYLEENTITTIVYLPI